MISKPVYMDNHSTTRVDPRVIDAIHQTFAVDYGNAGSTSHVFGLRAREAVEESRLSIAQSIGASANEIVFTSGATESNNLAIRGLAEWPRQSGNHIVSLTTEHKAILDPLARLARRKTAMTLVSPRSIEEEDAGLVDVDKVAAAITEDTFLVSVMLANNEIGVIQPLQEIGELCRERGIILHSDATQAVGRIPVDVEQLQVDMMSFSAHKMYGPKGIGALYVRRKSPSIRLSTQIDGGGQERGMRSGTLNVPGIVGFAKALEISLVAMEGEANRLANMRDRLFAGLQTRVPDIRLNGPDLADRALRLAGNLNVSFADVDGEALMMNMPDLAVSSGSACTSANPEPSHVLRAIGLSDDLTRSSLRFGLGRFNQLEEIAFAVEVVASAVERLRAMSA